MRREATGRERVSTAPGIVLGLGLGGFVDGIGLHQIAQWHNMGSAVLAPTTLEAMSRNMAWDGWFHVAVWTLTVIGVYMLLRDARAGLRMPSVSGFTGLLVLGWGLFNLVEGVVDHHLLEIHHVRDMPVHVPVYDWIFLVGGGLGLVVLGWLLARRDSSPDGVARGGPEHEREPVRHGH